MSTLGMLRSPHNATPAADQADYELIAQVVCGDEDALCALYERYYRLIFSVALRITDDHAVAEEVLQDVFVAIWRTAASFRSGSSLSAWLIGIARHRAIDATRSRSFRSRSREHALDPELPIFALDNADDYFDQQQLCQLVRAAIGQLTPVQREAIDLAYYHGLSGPEIAARLGLPVGTVKTRLRLGIIRLRQLLGAHA